MPRQKIGYPNISGRMKDKVYYFRRDKKKRKHYHIRKAAARVAQTTATKKAATDFGDASKSSRLIRNAIKEYTQLCYDNKLCQRLNKKMAEILRADVTHPAGQRILTAHNMKELKNFQFNKEASTHQLLKNAPEIQTKDGINISFDGTFNNRIHALRNTTHISIKAIALSVNLAKGTTQKLESNTVLIKRGEKFSPVTMKINRRNLTLIILEVKSFYGPNPSENKKGHVLDVIEVLPPVEELRRKYKNKAPHFWLPYATSATPALIITPVKRNSLPEG